MFEEKKTKGEVQMIGTFVDVFEFADRWSRFSTFQKAVLKSNSYVGTLDDFAVYLDYSAPMGNIYRKQLVELCDMGIVHVEDFHADFYETHKDEFDHYDYDHSPKRKNVKMFFIPEPRIVANRILMLKENELPDHTAKGPAVRKSVDRRDEYNRKKKESRKVKK